MSIIGKYNAMEHKRKLKAENIVCFVRTESFFTSMEIKGSMIEIIPKINAVICNIKPAPLIAQSKMIDKHMFSISWGRLQINEKYRFCNYTYLQWN